MNAMWNNTVIAESNDTVVVEGNHYFPRESLHPEFFRESSTTYECPWKGHADYFDVVIGDEVNEDAAWHYDVPKDAAAQIARRVAFGNGVVVSE